MRDFYDSMKLLTTSFDPQSNTLANKSLSPVPPMTAKSSLSFNKPPVLQSPMQGLPSAFSANKKMTLKKQLKMADKSRFSFQTGYRDLIRKDGHSRLED